jgi:hypothetical protein
VFVWDHMPVRLKHNEGWQLLSNAAIRKRGYSASDSFSGG